MRSPLLIALCALVAATASAQTKYTVTDLTLGGSVSFGRAINIAEQHTVSKQPGLHVYLLVAPQRRYLYGDRVLA